MAKKLLMSITVSLVLVGVTHAEQSPQFSGYLEPKMYNGPVPTGPGVDRHPNNTRPSPGPRITVIPTQPDKKKSGKKRLTPEELKTSVGKNGKKKEDLPPSVVTQEKVSDTGSITTIPVEPGTIAPPPFQPPRVNPNAEMQKEMK